MNFFRRSLITKSVSLFALLIAVLVVVGIYFERVGITTVSTTVFFGTFVVMNLLFLTLFIAAVMRPLGRVVKQVHNLLGGRIYQRVEPTTVDEIGVMTHFFNEITQDLEKISYDIKERRRMSSELDIAAQIQHDVLPKEAPDAPGLDVVAKTRTASEVGGDTFDFLSSADGSQVFIYVGDVTGHGVPAGLIMMMVDTLVTTMVSQGVSNGRDLIVNTNALLTPRISSRLFMTAVMLRWDKAHQQLFYTGAGHEHILIYRAKEEKVEAIKSGGIALGMIPNVSQIIQEKPIPLEIGDSVLLYSDGIIEAKNQTGEMFGLDRFADSFKKHGYRPSADNIFDHLTEDFSQFVGEYVQADDITMIVMKYTGDQGSSSPIQLAVNTEKPQNSKVWSWS